MTDGLSNTLAFGEFVHHDITASSQYAAYPGNMRPWMDGSYSSAEPGGPGDEVVSYAMKVLQYPINARSSATTPAPIPCRLIICRWAVGTPAAATSPLPTEACSSSTKLSIFSHTSGWPRAMEEKVSNCRETAERPTRCHAHARRGHETHGGQQGTCPRRAWAWHPRARTLCVVAVLAAPGRLRPKAPADPAGRGQGALPGQAAGIRRRVVPAGKWPLGAQIGPDGTFRLSTYREGDGAAPETHR